MADAEIVLAVSDALARFGVAGEVTIEDDRLFVTGAGAKVGVPLGSLQSEWRALAAGVQKRRSQELARKLAEQRRSSAQSKSSSFEPLLAIIKPLFVLLLGGVALYVAYRQLAPSQNPIASHDAVDRLPEKRALSAADQLEHERNQRAARVCENTRARVLRGALLGPADVEGWVVEVLLLRAGNPDPLFKPEALTGLLERTSDGAAWRFVWERAKRVASVQTLGAEVQVSAADVEHAGNTPARGMLVTFKGGYVTPFFSEEERGDYLIIAEAIADRLAATHGALYARCASGATHHLGAWFLGPSPGGAAASLVYFMGTYADVPHVRDDVIKPNGTLNRAHAFAELSRASEAVVREKLATWIGTHHGMIAGRPGQRTVITFPFKDANRAARASLVVADALGVSRKR